MPVYSAFTIPTLGMRAQSHSLSTIGNNIANVSTGGFKRTDTHFSTLLSQTMDKQSDIGGLKPKDISQITQQGRMEGSNRDLDLAINGQGFFILKSSATGGGQTFYGRDGSFEMATLNSISVSGTPSLDASGNLVPNTVSAKDGYLVDKNGYFLQGWTADPSTGLFTSSSLSSLRIDPYAFAVAGQATTTASLEMNLPATDSPGLAQVTEITIAGSVGVLEAGNTYTVNVDGTPVTYTATGSEADLNALRDAIVLAINADTTVSAQVTASASLADGKILLTGKTLGASQTISGSATKGGVSISNVLVGAPLQTAVTSDTQNYNIEVFDSNGNARSIRLDFAKTANNTWDLSTTVGKTPIAQVDTITLAGTIEVGDIYSISVAGVPFSVTAGATDTLTTIRDSLLTSINADNSINVTAVASGPDALVLTANVAGTAFSSTTSATNRTAIAQADSLTLSGTYAAGDTISVTIDANPALIYTVVANDLTVDGVGGAAVAGGSSQAYNNITAKITAAISADVPTSSVVTPVSSGNGTGVITLTATTAGTPFTLASSAATAPVTANLSAIADNTSTKANTTANVSPSDTTTTFVSSISFNADGSLATNLDGTLVSNPLVQANAVNLAVTFPPVGTIPTGTGSLALDISKFTQFSGSFQPFSYSKNGFVAANSQSIRFDSKGHVIATFDDSSFRTVYKIPLAEFSNANALQEFNGNVYQETEQSGSALVVDAEKTGYASFLPSTHELSNVDLAGEFTRMMMTQTAYNSSSTVFKTIDEMITAARDLKR